MVVNNLVVQNKFLNTEVGVVVVVQEFVVCNKVVQRVVTHNEVVYLLFSIL